VTRLWPALAAALLLVGPAAAEPIPWTYTPAFAGNLGSQYVTTGFGARLDPFEPDGLRHYQGYTKLTAAPGGGHAGSAVVTVGAVAHGEFYWTGADAPPPAFPVDPNFVAAITITDTASGQSGTVSVIGTATSQDSWLGAPADANLPDAGQMWGDASWVQDLTLGGNRYRVAFGERKTNPRDGGPFLGGTWDALDVVADVRVVPDVHAPEPGTLALAGIGLVGLVGLIGVRRRR
jgi:hypothetical protein